MIDNDQKNMVQEMRDALASLDSFVANGGVRLGLALASSFEDPDLAREIKNEIVAATRLLQSLYTEIDASEASQPKYAGAPSKEQTTARRAPSKQFDHLLLQGLEIAAEKGKPVGVTELFDLGSKLDDQVKRPSLISKLNRWRNEKAWVTWTTSDDIAITEEGTAQAAHLKRFLNEEQLEAIQSAFDQSWDWAKKI